MRSRRFLLALLTGLSLVVLVPSTSYACSCAAASTAQYADQADVVVRGTFEGLDDGPPKAVVGSGDDVVYDLAVAEVYKGSSPRVIEVHSARLGASCGLGVAVGTGQDYLVFASRRDGQYAANLCNGTAPATADRTAELVAHTGPGRPPEGGAPADPSPDQRPQAQGLDDPVRPLAAPADGGAGTGGAAAPAVLAGLGGAGAVAAAGIWLARRRRRS